MNDKHAAPAPKPAAAAAEAASGPRRIMLHTRFAVLGAGDAFTVYDAGAELAVGTDIPADQADAAIASGAAVAA